jgi:hypothetical protein
VKAVNIVTDLRLSQKIPTTINFIGLGSGFVADVLKNPISFTVGVE